jgi:hypothetical protein
MLYWFTERKRRCEIKCAGTERAAQLHVIGALLAVVGMRRLFAFFLLLCQILKRMVQCVHCSGLLREQQGKDHQEPDG